MKIFIGLTFLFLCMYIGYIVSQKFIKRKLFYSDFERFNKKLISEISFSQRSIKSLLECEKSTDFFNCISHKITNSENLNELKYLTADDLSLLTSYLDNIGVGDKVTQLNYLKNALSDIENNFKIATAEEKKYKTLYVKIGFLIGLILFVVII